MPRLRLIARLDIKGPNLIKGVHLEGLRIVGDPQEFAMRYYDDGADELIYMDAVASLYGRNSLVDVVRRTAENVFIPMTVGGGVRGVADAEHLLRAGADKVAVNTAAVRDPNLLEELSRRFGSQCVVLQVDAKRQGPARWEVYTDGGRERSGRDVVEWIREAEDRGAGEVLLTSVDREGTGRGFDLELAATVNTVLGIPLIVSGGMGSFEHLRTVVNDAGADAVAMAAMLHYGKASLRELRSLARAHGMEVRSIAGACISH